MKRLLKIIALVAMVLPAFASNAHAALLEGGKLSMSTPRSGQSSNHTYTFTKASSGGIGKIYFQWCKESGSSPSDTCTATDIVPTLNLSSVTYQAADETANWTLTWDTTDTFEMRHDTQSGSGTTGEYIVTMDSIQNPTYTDCSLTKPGDSTTGTCFVRIFTFTNSASSTVLDSTVVTATITQPISVTARVNPIFTLSVAGVLSGQTPHSGGAITTDVSSSTTAINFGNLTPSDPKYAAHTLTVVSNTVGGYTVTANMLANLSGQAYDQFIQPFAAPTVASNNAVAWTTPTGSVAGTNTGWLGISTNDAGAPGYASNELFYPLGTFEQPVVYSTQTTLSDAVNVIIAIEVNALQAADNYTGTLVYDSVPVY